MLQPFITMHMFSLMNTLVFVEQEDQSIWAMRPLKRSLFFVLMQKVRYLRLLKKELQRQMLQDFYDGVDIYLSVHRDANKEELVRHDVSVSYKQLSKVSLLGWTLRLTHMFMRMLAAITFSENSWVHGLEVKRTQNPLIHFKIL